MSRFRTTMALAAILAATPLHFARTAPPTEKSLFSRAVREYSSREWEAAAGDFERFLAAQPDSPQAPEATYWLGESLLQLGRIEDADRAFERLVRKWPQHMLASEAWFRRGETAFWSGRTADAQSWLERFIDSNAKSPHRYYALLYLAEMAVEREDLPEVETLRNRFLELDRNERLDRPERSDRNERKPREPGAAATGHHVLRPAIDRAWGKALLQAAQYDLAAQIFSDKRLRTPEDAYYHGVALLGLKQFAAADQRTQRVWTDELPAELRPRLLILRASLLIELSRDDDAVRALDEYLETMSATRDALWARQQRLQIPLRQGRIDEAIGHWLSNTGAELPSSERGRIGLVLAEAAFSAGKQADAEHVYQTIAADEQLASVHAAAHVNLGWLAWKRDEPKVARDAFARCLAARPNATRLAEAAFGLGQAYERLGEPTSALMAYEQVVARPSTDVHVAPALLALARLHVAMGQHERAEVAYRRLVDEFPQIRQRDAALYGWSWTLADLARPDDAVRGWQRLTAEFPDSPFAADARLRLAEAAYRRQRHRDARRWLDELVARPVDAKLAEHAIYLRGRLAADAGDWAVLEVEMRKLSESAQSPELRHAADYWVAESLYRRDAWHEALDRFTRLDQWVALHRPANNGASPGSPVVRNQPAGTPATQNQPAENESGENESAGGKSAENVARENVSRADGVPENLPGADSPSDPAWLAMIPLRRAQLLARQSRWADAQRVVEEARQRHPSFRFAYEWDFIDAQCLAALGRTDEARRTWERVVRSPSGGRSETAAAAQWQIGQSWQLAGNLAAAEDSYAALERVYPTSPWRVRAMLGRAQCLERQREWESAVRTYAAILQEFPVGAWSEQAEAGLREARRAALQSAAKQVR